MREKDRQLRRRRQRRLKRLKRRHQEGKIVDHRQSGSKRKKDDGPEDTPPQKEE